MNKQNKKGQTATEYMIIVAVVIVIAVVVASILGGFPGIGSGTTKNIDNYKLKTEKVAVDNYATVGSDSLIKIRNNHWDTLRADSVSVNGDPCTDSNNNLPATLKVGQSITLNCTGVTLVEGVTPNIQINWTDLATGASYTIGESVSSGTGGTFESLTMGSGLMFEQTSTGVESNLGPVNITMNFGVKLE